MHTFKDQCPVGMKQTYLKVMGRISNFSAEDKPALNKIFGDAGDINKIFEHGQHFAKPVINDPMNAGLSVDQKADRIVEQIRVRVEQIKASVEIG